MESLSRLTEEAKEELKKFWELCYISRDQMEGFRPYYDGLFTVLCCIKLFGPLFVAVNQYLNSCLLF